MKDQFVVMVRMRRKLFIDSNRNLKVEKSFGVLSYHRVPMELKKKVNKNATYVVILWAKMLGN